MESKVKSMGHPHTSVLHRELVPPLASDKQPFHSSIHPFLSRCGAAGNNRLARRRINAAHGYRC